jgi:hypothetical protein
MTCHVMTFYYYYLTIFLFLIKLPKMCFSIYMKKIISVPSANQFTDQWLSMYNIFARLYFRRLVALAHVLFKVLKYKRLNLRIRL